MFQFQDLEDRTYLVLEFGDEFLILFHSLDS